MSMDDYTLPPNPFVGVSTEEIIEELKRRSSVVLILRTDRAEDDGSEMVMHYQGNFWTCLGMAAAFVHSGDSSRGI